MDTILTSLEARIYQAISKDMFRGADYETLPPADKHQVMGHVDLVSNLGLMRLISDALSTD